MPGLTHSAFLGNSAAATSNNLDQFLSQGSSLRTGEQEAKSDFDDKGAVDVESERTEPLLLGQADESFADIFFND